MGIHVCNNLLPLAICMIFSYSKHRISVSCNAVKTISILLIVVLCNKSVYTEQLPQNEIQNNTCEKNYTQDETNTGKRFCFTSRRISQIPVSWSPALRIISRHVKQVTCQHSIWQNCSTFHVTFYLYSSVELCLPKVHVSLFKLLAHFK